MARREARKVKRSGRETSGRRRAGEGAARETADALLVSGNFFDVLRVPMAAGRAFAGGEDRLGAPTGLVVLACDFWQRRHGGSPDIIGKHLRLNI